MPPQNPELSAFHQPAASVPGGHVFRLLLIVQQNTVQPDAQSAAGPHSDAYAVPGRSRYRSGFTASAEPTTAVFTRKLRRLVVLAIEAVGQRRDDTVGHANHHRDLELVEQLVHLRDDAGKMSTAAGDDVQTEGASGMREELLATELTGQRSLKPVRCEQLGTDARNALRREQRRPDRFGPIFEHGDEHIRRSHEIRDTTAEVVAVLGQDERRRVHHRVGALAGVERGPAADACFPSIRNAHAEPVRDELRHRTETTKAQAGDRLRRGRDDGGTRPPASKPRHARTQIASVSNRAGRENRERSRAIPNTPPTIAPPSTDPETNAQANAIHVADEVTIVANATPELRTETGAVDPAPIRHEPVLVDLATRARNTCAEYARVDGDPDRGEHADAQGGNGGRGNRDAEHSQQRAERSAGNDRCRRRTRSRSRHSAGSGPAPRAG